MPVIHIKNLPVSGGAPELEGYLHGDVPASLIFIDADPGDGPRLHSHPYAEIFIVLEGSSTFTVGEEAIEASADQVLIAPAGVPHKFVNTGDGRLRQLDIHLSDRFETEWLEE